MKLLAKKTRNKKLYILCVYFFWLFPFCEACATVATNYDEYARTVALNKNKIIAPFSKDVSLINKKILLKQNSPEIKNLKAEIHEETKLNSVTENNIDSSIKIFVSFSMPKESLKGWLMQAQKIKAPVYIRGLVNNSFKETIKFVGAIINNSDINYGMLIDPSPFKNYEISEVPAVVVTNRDDFDVIYGDVTLDYALEKIADSSKQSNILHSAISKLRGKTNAR